MSIFNFDNVILIRSCDLVAKVSASGRPLNGLISIAGIAQQPGALVEITDAEIRSIFDVNCFGAFRLISSFFPLLKYFKKKTKKQQQQQQQLPLFLSIWYYLSFQIERRFDSYLWFCNCNASNRVRKNVFQEKKVNLYFFFKSYKGYYESTKGALRTYAHGLRSNEKRNFSRIEISKNFFLLTHNCAAELEPLGISVSLIEVLILFFDYVIMTHDDVITARRSEHRLIECDVRRTQTRKFSLLKIL